MNQWKIVHEGGVIEPKKGTYEADPFLFEHNGEMWLFYELYDYNKGVIAARKFPDGEPQVVLELKHHLSFPCIWEENGKIFMMPETGASDLVILECQSFPDKWVEVFRRNGNFADSIYYKGLIFTSENGDHNLMVLKDGGVIFHTERMNSRCAGNIIEQEGKLIRPTQLCEGGYGNGVILKEIQLGTFEEREITRILPTGSETGLHTFNYHTKSDLLVWDVRHKL